MIYPPNPLAQRVRYLIQQLIELEILAYRLEQAQADLPMYGDFRHAPYYISSLELTGVRSIITGAHKRTMARADAIQNEIDECLGIIIKPESS